MAMTSLPRRFSVYGRFSMCTWSVRFGSGKLTPTVCPGATLADHGVASLLRGLAHRAVHLRDQVAGPRPLGQPHPQRHRLLDADVHLPGVWHVAVDVGPG